MIISNAHLEEQIQSLLDRPESLQRIADFNHTTVDEVRVVLTKVQNAPPAVQDQVVGILLHAVKLH